MGSAVSFSYGARGPHPRALGALAPRAGRGRSAGADERDDFVRTETRARCQGRQVRLMLPRIEATSWTGPDTIQRANAGLCPKFVTGALLIL